MVTLECPRASDTTFELMPVTRPSVAKARRRPWKVNGGIASSLIKNRKFSVRVPGSTGDQVAAEKIIEELQS
jgi:hypothetical protein